MYTYIYTHTYTYIHIYIYTYRRTNNLDRAFDSKQVLGNPSRAGYRWLPLVCAESGHRGYPKYVGKCVFPVYNELYSNFT